MYKIFSIPKRSGGFRRIEAPNESLKKGQKEELKELKKKLKVSPFAHAFQPYKNIVTMAIPHVKKRWIGSIDIKDFFPSITLGNAMKHIKTKEGSLSEESLSLHFYDFGDGKGMRLPQGGPASPLISNAYLFHFDWMMSWVSYRLGCDYSRYADDLVFSGDIKNNIAVLIKVARQSLESAYELNINNRKTKLLFNKRRQLVCGVVVNEKINLPRRWRKKLRAALHQAEFNGGMDDVLRGRMAFNDMVLKNTKETFSSREICDSVVVAKYMAESQHGN